MTDQIKILVIEDDLYTRDLFVETLTSAGYVVDKANDGVEGLMKIQEGGYKLILLDAMMPKMDGLTVLQRMKSMVPKNPNGPVIMSTNLAGDLVLNQALEAGAKACFIKTDLNPDQLIEKVKEFLA